MAKTNRERVYKTFCVSIANQEVLDYLEELRKNGVNVSRLITNLLLEHVNSENKGRD